MLRTALPKPLILVAVTSLLLPAAALAESIPTTREITSVRAAGMGDAAIGFASSSEALEVNPAGIAANLRFNADAQAVFEPAYGYRVLSISSIDSKLNAETSFPLAGGAAYHYYRSGEGDQARNGSIAMLGLALPLWPEVLSIGTTLKYLRLSGAVEANAVTLDAGLLLRPFALLGIGAVGYNLINVYSPEAQRAWGFGVALGTDASFHIDADARLDRDASGSRVFSYRAGAEYLIANLVVPRVGYIQDRLRDVRKLTGGVSVIAGPVAIEAAYQHSLGSKGRYFGIGVRMLDM